MPANQYGIDLGEIYRTAETVKGARTRNKASSLELGELERKIKERPAKEAAARKQKNLIAQNVQGALSGDAGALNTLYVLDADTAKTIADRVSTMSEQEREQAKSARIEMAQMAAWVQDAKTPEEALERLANVASTLPEESANEMQKELEGFGGDAKKYASFSLGRVKDVDTIFENPESIRVGGEDVVYKGGREVERQARPDKSSGGGGGAGGLKSADESLMYRQSVELLGGIFDQAGNITNLDPDVRNRVQGIATEATNIFRAGGVTRSQAVKQAAKKFGLDVPDADMANNDPLGIR